MVKNFLMLLECNDVRIFLLRIDIFSVSVIVCSPIITVEICFLLVFVVVLIISLGTSATSKLTPKVNFSRLHGKWGFKISYYRYLLAC